MGGGIRQRTFGRWHFRQQHIKGRKSFAKCDLCPSLSAESGCFTVMVSNWNPLTQIFWHWHGNDQYPPPIFAGWPPSTTSIPSIPFTKSWNIENFCKQVKHVFPSRRWHKIFLSQTAVWQKLQKDREEVHIQRLCKSKALASPFSIYSQSKERPLCLLLASPECICKCIEGPRKNFPCTFTCATALRMPFKVPVLGRSLTLSSELLIVN